MPRFARPGLPADPACNARPPGHLPPCCRPRQRRCLRQLRRLRAASSPSAASSRSPVQTTSGDLDCHTSPRRRERVVTDGSQRWGWRLASGAMGWETDMVEKVEVERVGVEVAAGEGIEVAAGEGITAGAVVTAEEDAEEDADATSPQRSTRSARPVLTRIWSRTAESVASASPCCAAATRAGCEVIWPERSSMGKTGLQVSPTREDKRAERRNLLSRRFSGVALERSWRTRMRSSELNCEAAVDSTSF